MNIHDDFEEFLQFLKDEETEFVIIGGYAVAYHGYVRTTNDMDLFFRNKAENIHKIKRALLKFGFTNDSLKLADFYGKGNIIRMGIPPIKIEMCNSISGVTFAQVWKNKIKGKYGNVDVYYIGFKELIKNKKASGRPKDLTDVDELDS